MKSLIRYNPRGLSLFDDIDRVFRSLLDETPGAVCRSPQVDIRENEGEFVLEAELPGLSVFAKDEDGRVFSH